MHENLRCSAQDDGDFCDTGGYGMDFGPFEYTVERIEGDYAVLKRCDIEATDEKLVARALLPQEIMEGSKLRYECLEYTVIK